MEKTVELLSLDGRRQRRQRREDSYLKHFEIPERMATRREAEDFLRDYGMIVHYEKHGTMHHFYYVGLPVREGDVRKAFGAVEGVFTGGVCNLNPDTQRQIERKGWRVIDYDRK
ncbi:hypothetical protein DRO48_00860 [Candidatus Bathyarchaeota archaeon]|nr:MAG: hypothetical protein DRO48_00860 [Candidatus Bathyarchaeota archaeon]